MEQNIVKLAEKLIRFKSTGDNLKELKHITDFAENYFQSAKLNLKRIIKNKKHSLIVSTKKTKSFDILLLGHLDVVPADEKQFKPYVKGNKLYGRGAGDMKGADAALMHLIKNLPCSLKKKNIALILTTDEEIGGEDGAKYLTDKLHYRSKIVIAPDSGSLTDITYCEKGVLRIKLTSFGKSAHSAKLWDGENAIEKLINIYKKIQNKFSPPRKNAWKNTCNLGFLRGGDVFNRVPEIAEMGIDIRFIKNKDKYAIKKYVRKIIDKKTHASFLNGHDVLYTPPKNKFIQLYKKISQDILCKKINLIREPWASDASYFGAHGAVSFLAMPKKGNIHGKNEWVKISDLKIFCKILETYLRNI